MSLLADTVLMRRRQALIWSADRAGANHHLLTYTSWPPHTGLFSIASCKNKIIAFLILVRAAWLHLWQVRAIMSDWRKWQLLILSLWWGRGRERTPAELNCSHHTCWCCGHSPVIICVFSFQPTHLSWFKAFVEVPTYSFSFPPPPPVSCPVSLLLVVHFRNETVMSCCFIFGSVSFRNETEIWKMGVA